MRILKGISIAGALRLAAGCREFDPIEDTESRLTGSRASRRARVAESSIRLRILKVFERVAEIVGRQSVAESSIRLRILKDSLPAGTSQTATSCREFDPIEDTERWKVLPTAGFRKSCREFDPIEDTESLKPDTAPAYRRRLQRVRSD